MKKQAKIVKTLSLLVRGSKRTQKDIASAADISPSQLSRFLNGRSEMHLSSFIVLLDELGIDLHEILKKKTKKVSELEDLNLSNIEDCLVHLFRNLDEVGQQTQLRQLAWANKVSKKEIPNQIKKILKDNITLI